MIRIPPLSIVRTDPKLLGEIFRGLFAMGGCGTLNAA